MARNTGRDRRPFVRKVEQVEVSERHIRLRWILFVAALVVGVGAMVYGLVSATDVGTGWQQIESNTNDGQTCSREFVFSYQLGRSGISAALEARQLTARYTDLTDKAYRVYHEGELFPDCNNVCYINQHPGESIEVDPWLYQAFDTLEKSGSRALYLAPYYDEYRNLFAAENDAEAMGYDPYLNPDKAAEFLEIAEYVNDPAHVKVTLLGDNVIRLEVSDAYKAYAAENGIERYIDFFWMKNAFIADNIADAMIKVGYYYGTITSYDGFTRNFDRSGAEYSFSLMDERADKVLLAAQMRYTQPRSMVFLRTFALSELDTLHYYRAGDGTMRVPYVSARDGLCRAALPTLVGYSPTASCAELMLDMLPVFAADELDEAALKAMSGRERYTIWFREGVLCHTDKELRVEELYAADSLTYTTDLKE